MLQIVPYQLLKQSLEVSDERELEDFLITSCIYSGARLGSAAQSCIFELRPYDAVTMLPANTLASRAAAQCALSDLSAPQQLSFAVNLL